MSLNNDEFKSKLLKSFENADESIKALAFNMIDEYLFVEENLKTLKKYPFITVNPQNQSQQRQTAAGKQYKEFLQQKTQIFKALCKVLNDDSIEEESPLRKYLKTLEKREY